MKVKNQKTIKILLLGTLIFGMGGFLLSSKPVLAATGINKQINFQGKVVNTDGTNVSTASYTFLFCIYTTASPTTACTSGADNDAVWRESKSITVTDGIFQTNLGDTTALPGSVDFNTDNIYLGVNFNANGQMTPLVRFTAAPYAMNADKVHGLTVTDTTGTLTIAAGKTLTASNTLTFQGTDGSTLNVGSGGTLGTAAYTASTAYLASGDSTQNGYFGNIYLDDTDASHHLILDEGSDLTADRILSIVTGDAARTLTFSGNLNVSADATISNTNTGDQSIFQTFAVSGQSNVVADSTTDTVTLIAGTNITITTNATNDEITINSTGGGSPTPWTSDIDADGYDLNDLSNILFRETTGAPVGTDVGFYRDNTGDLTGNVLTGKTFNLAVNGTDEYNFSSSALAMNSNILQDIGNTGTDFVASTGALTLAGVLTANGGISLAGSQSLSAAALSYVDLGLITHSTTANQGLRLPNAASATPSNPTSGEGYLAWDAAGNQLITYNGSAWTTVGGGSGANTALSNLASVAINTDLIGAVAGGMGIRGGSAANDDLILEGTTNATRTTSYVILQPNGGNVGIGTATPASMLDIFGTANMLRLSYDASNYATLASDSTGNLVINNSSATQNIVLIGDGSATDSSVQFDGNVNDYYVGQDDTDDFLHIGTGSVVGTNAYITLDSTGKVGIGDATPDAKLDVDSVQTSGTLVGVLDSTAIIGAIIGESITLSGSGAFDQTGLEFNLSGASGTNLNDIVGSGSTWKVSKGGAATLSSVTSSGAIAANGGLTTTTTDQALTFSANGAGDFVFNVDSGTFVSLTGGADGVDAMTITAGGLTLTDGDLNVSAGDFNATLDAADVFNISKTGSDAGDVANITASSVNAIDGLQIDLTSTADTGADNVNGLAITWTESTDADVWSAINIGNTTSTNSTTQGLVIGTGYDTGISVASGGITATGSIVFTNTGAGASLTVNDESADTTPFVIDAAGNVGVGTSSPNRVLDIVQAASAPQLRLSKDLTYYSEFTVDSVGDLLVGAVGGDIRALSENVWVCDNDACPAITLTGEGNIFVENVLKFGNGVYIKNDSATELTVYDNDDQAMLVFDEL